MAKPCITTGHHFCCKPVSEAHHLLVLQWRLSSCSFGWLFVFHDQSCTSYGCFGSFEWAELDIALYCDADFAGDSNDAKSASGFVTALEGKSRFALLSWGGHKQGVVCRSTTESDFVSLSGSLFAEGLPILKLWQTIYPSMLLRILEDNKAVISIIAKGFSQKLRRLAKTHRVHVASSCRPSIKTTTSRSLMLALTIREVPSWPRGFLSWSGGMPYTCWTWKAHAAWQFKSMMGMSFAWMWLSPPYSFMICFLKSLGSANRTVCWHNWVCLHTSKVLPLSLRLSLSFLPSPAKFWSLAAKTLLHLHPVGLQASVIDMHGTLLHGIVRHGRFLNGIECIKWAVSFHLDLRVHGSP